MIYYKNGEKIVKSVMIPTSDKFLQLKTRAMANANEEDGIVNNLNISRDFFGLVVHSANTPERAHGELVLNNSYNICLDSCDQASYLKSSRNADVNIMKNGNARAFDFNKKTMPLFASLDCRGNCGWSSEGFELYDILHPAITEMFVKGSINTSYEELIEAFNNNFDMTKLINSNIDNLQVAKEILKQNKDVQLVRSDLERVFPEFAIFMFDIVPNMCLKQLDVYSIDELKALRALINESHLSTTQIDNILNEEKIAEENTKILSYARKISLH